MGLQKYKIIIIKQINVSFATPYFTIVCLMPPWKEDAESLYRAI